jgi:hypothetical protein
MNEQSVAWLAEPHQHDPSPEELRDREHLRALASRRLRRGLRERLAAITGVPAADQHRAPALACCAA